MTTTVAAVIPSIPPRRELLQRALASVLAQTRPVDEIHVAVDHGRQGAAVTRNRALAGATTEFVAFLDDDDVWYPQHLEHLLAHQAETGADVCWPWYDTDPPGGEPLPAAFEGRQWDPDGPHQFPIVTLVRRELAMQVGGFPEHEPVSTRCAGEDFSFWLLLRDAGARFAHLAERTWCWTITGNTSGLPSRWPA